MSLEPTNAGGREAGQGIFNISATIRRDSEIIISPPVRPDVSPANVPSLRASCGKRS